MWLPLVVMLAGEPEMAVAQREAARSAEAAEKQRLAILSLTALHPDWKEREARMSELAAKLRPARGVGQYEYVELLYELSATCEEK